MIKLFIKALLALSLFFCHITLTFAEEVTFLITSSTSDEKEEMVIVYSSNGYRGKTGNQTISMEATENLTTLTFGDNVVTIIAKGGYWHTDLGVQRVYPVISSSYGIGFHKLTYLGKIHGKNKLYHEEVWLNGFLSFMVKSVLDTQDRLLESVTFGETITYTTRK